MEQGVKKLMEKASNSNRFDLNSRPFLASIAMGMHAASLSFSFLIYRTKRLTMVSWTCNLIQCNCAWKLSSSSSLMKFVKEGGDRY